MKDMIERYVFSVTRRLPEAQRSEVSAELRANIDDMLPDNADEAEIKDVLVTLGEPRKLAAEYQSDKKSLISNEWMSDYVMVLKIVLVIFGSISLVFALIDAIVNPEAATVIGIVAEAFAKVISQVISSLLSGFAIVTLIFAALSNYAGKCKNEPFDPEKLPALPNQTGKKISRTGTLIELIVETVFGVVLIFLLWNNQTYLVWYDELSGWNQSVPMLNAAVLKTYIPLFIFSLALAFSHSAIKLDKGQWTIFVAAVHTIYQILSAAILISFINLPGLVSQAFILEAASYFTIEASVIENGIRSGALGFSIFIGILIVIDLIDTWVKTLKSANVSTKAIK